MLSHIRVVDFCSGVSQFAGHLLARLGAEVIAVEPPTGVATRHMGPYANNTPDPNRALLEVGLTGDWIESPVSGAVGQPPVLLGVGRIGNGQVPGAEEETLGPGVECRLDDGVEADGDPGFDAAAFGRDLGPLTVLDAEFFRILRMHLHVHLGDQLTRRSGADGLGGVEMLVDDARRPPERVPILRTLTKLHPELLFLWQLGSQAHVAGFHQQVVVVDDVEIRLGAAVPGDCRRASSDRSHRSQAKRARGKRQEARDC